MSATGTEDSATGGCCGGGSAGDSATNSAGGCCGGEETAAFEGTDARPIHLTEAAVKAVKEAIEAEGEAGDSLRVSVIGGGCSGYQYNLDFEKESRMGDIPVEFGDVTILIDPVSAGLLKGTVVDFVSGLNGTGFKFENPNANRTCGCGSSFG